MPKMARPAKPCAAGLGMPQGRLGAAFTLVEKPS